MKALRSLRHDLTYTQDVVPDKIRSLGRNLFGSDMSAFTDRYPIEVLHEIIHVRYGAKLANH